MTLQWWVGVRLQGWVRGWRYGCGCGGGDIMGWAGCDVTGVVVAGDITGVCVCV